MKKSCIFVFLTVMSCLFLTSCTKKYEKKDVEDYLQNKIGISGYHLSDEVVKKDEDGNEDYYYHVAYKDIEFDVVNDFYDVDNFGFESLTNQLRSNFDEVVKDYYYNRYSNKSSIVYDYDLVYHKKNLICSAANENKEIDENKLRHCYDSIYDFISTIDFANYPISNISVELTNDQAHVKWLTIYKDKKITTFDQFK